ncbi:MAG: CoA-binding protein [Deltaproteobacteria bacterium]|nr:CoA-binding protein [Deltaproteobacteria bacterium]
MNALFYPGTVAVIGASDNPGKLGYHVMTSLSAGGYPGALVPVNPGAESIMNIKAYPSIESYRGDIDLAIVVLPAKLVSGVFHDCIRKGIRGIVLITAGFKEIDDPEGGELQEELARIAGEAQIPVIGPNTFGMINLPLSVNASFTPEFSLLKKGSISLVSQSGGIAHLMAFLAMERDIGMSKIVGLGNRLNVDFAEMFSYLSTDPDTKVIALYLEGLDDPRRLMEVAKKHRGNKPAVAYKTGSAFCGDQASLSHTGSLAGRQEIYEGALKQAGILPVRSAEALLDTARSLAMSPLPKGSRIAVLSGQAGPGMAACDLCEAQGLDLAVFRAETQRLINDLLPPLALRTNPVDMGPAWYNASAIVGIIRAVLEDEGVDGLLLLMMFASANRAAPAAISPLLLEWKQRKPVVSCLASPPGIWDEEIRTMEAGGALINCPTPERAAMTMASLWNYQRMRK